MYHFVKFLIIVNSISRAFSLVQSMNSRRVSRINSHVQSGSIRGTHCASTSTRPQRRAAARQLSIVNMSDRISDKELESIRLDPSTLSEAERKRLEGLRDIGAKMAKVQAAERELRASSTATAPALKATAPVMTEVPPEYAGMSIDERKRAESLASIERNLAEVSEIQRQLGLVIDEDEERDIEVSKTDWSGQAGMDKVLKDGARNWGDLSTRKWLALGDVVALTLFAYVGRASHGTGTFDIDVFATALPFVVGWLASSPFLGAYTISATSSFGDVGKSLVPAWAVSIPLGILIRAWSKGGEMPPVAFLVISMIFTLVALGSWRALYTVVNPTSTGQYKKGGLLDGFRMITTLLNRW